MNTPHDSLFARAIGRLDEAAAYVDVEAEVLERLRHPKTVTEVSVPVRMDDGSLQGEQTPAVITGKPLPLGGSPGRSDATGRGAYYCIKELEDIHQRLQKIMAAEFHTIYGRAEHLGSDMRTAAYAHALQRIGEAMAAKGTHTFFAGDAEG